MRCIHMIKLRSDVIPVALIRSQNITAHNIKWNHLDILAKDKTDYHYKIKETWLIQELKPAFNVNVGSEELMLY